MLSIIRDSSEETLAALAAEKALRQTGSFMLLLSFGSQYDRLIGLRCAKIGVYCAVADPSSVSAEDVRRLAPSGIILSGGPASVHAEPPIFDYRILGLGTPVLGICLGAQMAARYAGARVMKALVREFGVEHLMVVHASVLLAGLDRPCCSRVLMSHGDSIQPPAPAESPEFETLARTRNCLVAAFNWRHIWGVQFHPETSDTQGGEQLFKNFCFDICGITDPYPARAAAGQKVAALREQIAGKRLLIALSGGSDSSVCAYLAKHAASGAFGQIHAVYLKGLDRPDDEADLLRYFGGEPWLELEVVDATERFLSALAGKERGGEKRATVHHVYHDLLEEQIAKVGADCIMQGTLYTDLVESAAGYHTGARRAKIKQHHNTGHRFSVPELTPLDDCVKDTAREIGRDLGAPETLLIRHPFPGYGLAGRIEGEVTRQRLATARAADGILIEELRRAGLYEKIWQAGARVLASRHTTTKGDDAGEGCVVQCFAVASVDGLTARPYRLDWDVLERIAERMAGEIPEVGAVDIRISGKPPSTIEGE